MRSLPPRRRAPLRILTAVPLCDGHDSTIVTINLELARHGMEVIYLGYHQAASAIARAAVQEDVHAVGLSSYNGGHLVFFREVIAQLRARGGAHIRVFGGGGGTITAADARAMQRSGVERIFFPGTPLEEIVTSIRHGCATSPKAGKDSTSDRKLARSISLVERSPVSARSKRTRSGAKRLRTTQQRPFVVGVAGPGGAGKSTLIDELTARFLRANPGRRIGVLANDPSHPDSYGAILGDRVSAIHAQDDRVFFRSLATRGSTTGISAATAAAVSVLREDRDFDLILVESVGIGQDGDPFRCFSAAGSFVDAVLFVASPHYGGRIQLQKTALLSAADVVVLNKCDDPRATTARTELSERLAHNGRHPLLHGTIAARHADAGVDELYTTLVSLAGHEVPGGERACQLQIHD